MTETKTQERLKDMSRNGAFGNTAPIRKPADSEPKYKPRVDRSSAGLREALFDAIEKVRDGDMMAEDAKAISGLASQICNTVQLEIQVARLRTEYPSDTPLNVPAQLPLGTDSKGATPLVEKK